jgi:hypothetical protein
MMFRAFSSVRVAALMACLGVPFAACSSTDGGDGEPTCLDAAGTLDCSPLYGRQSDGSIAPTFQEVYDNTLTGCAVSGCHSGASPTGGMQLGTIDEAFASLHGKSSTGEPRITPGDIECGKVIVRLETVGESYSMPPANHLKDSELCSIRHWIKNGATR